MPYGDMDYGALLKGWIGCETEKSILSYGEPVNPIPTLMWKHMQL